MSREKSDVCVARSPNWESPTKSREDETPMSLRADRQLLRGVVRAYLTARARTANHLHHDGTARRWK